MRCTHFSREQCRKANFPAVNCTSPGEFLWNKKKHWAITWLSASHMKIDILFLKNSSCWAWFLTSTTIDAGRTIYFIMLSSFLNTLYRADRSTSATTDALIINHMCHGNYLLKYLYVHFQYTYFKEVLQVNFIKKPYNLIKNQSIEKMSIIFKFDHIS